MKDALYERAKNKVQLAAYFAREMIEELGRDKALAIIGRAYEKYSSDTFAEPYLDLPLEERFEKFKEDMKVKSEQGGHFTIVSESDRHLEVRFNRCPYYEVYTDLGVPEVCRKYCDADFTAFRNLHPGLKVERSHEIAYGDSYCNHRWVLEKQLP
jgi:predicted ArsR family transcriptional regulator